MTKDPEALVVLKDGTHIDDLIIKNGFGTHKKKKGLLSHIGFNRFNKLESHAITDKIGIFTGVESVYKLEDITRIENKYEKDAAKTFADKLFNGDEIKRVPVVIEGFKGPDKFIIRLLTYNVQLVLNFPGVKSIPTNVKA